MTANAMASWSDPREVPMTALSPLELDGYLTGIIVTPQATPIRPSLWVARLFDDEQPIFEDEAQINTVLGSVVVRHNTLLRDIDCSLKQLETDGTVDYRPLFLSDDEKPAHDTVRTWIRGFWKAMELAPESWSALVEDKRTNRIIAPFVGFFDLGKIEPDEIPDDIDERLDEDAALIPRMILILRKLARIREAASQPPLLRRTKIGRNDPCPCGSGKKYKRCCAGA